MTTAYLIHNSEGVPIRRVLDTFKYENGTLMAWVADCTDNNWERNKFESDFHELSSKYTKKRERQHHIQVRRRYQKQYGHRFEIYWPLTTIIGS